MFWGFFVRTNATISLTSHFVTTWVKLPGTQIKQKTINKCSLNKSLVITTQKTIL